MKAIIPEQKSNISVSLFDLNKQIIAQQPDYSDQDIVEAKKKIKELKETTQHAKYFMLLSNEINYYTLFTLDEWANASFENEVILCLKDFGDIKDIDWSSEKDSIDCWVKDFTDQIRYFKLFDYNKGVIECR